MVRELLAAFAASMLLTNCSHATSAADSGPVRIGLVTDIGGFGDRSFNDSAAAGLHAAQHILHADVAILPSKSAADYEPNLTLLAQKEYDLSVAIGDTMAHDVGAVAARFPARHFALIDAVADEPNVASVTFKDEEGSFLAGAAAALASQTHRIGFLGGVDIPLSRRFEAGYTAGAREIDPSITVDVKYVGDFDDAALASKLSGALYDGGVDVIFVAAGKAGIGAFEQVKARRGDYVIGVDSDQDALAPGKVLTSVVKRVDVAVFELAQDTVAQKVPSGNVVLGLKDDGIELTPFTYTRAVMTPKHIATLAKIRALITAGKIAPPASRAQLATFKRVPF